jgi:alanine racemase
MRPTWAEVSLDALRHNFRSIRQHVAPQATVMAVVKADAYGHGAAQCARALEAEGANWFGVTSTEEGVQLRQAGIRGRIVALSGFWPGEEGALIEHAITPTVWDAKQLELLEMAARRAKQNYAFPVHLKIDTGMTRLGTSVRELDTVLAALRSASGVVLEGVLTHLASAEILDASDCEAQIACFEAALNRIAASGLSPKYVHIANSAAILGRPQTWKNMVRPGISLYGYSLPLICAKREVPAPKPLALKPALTWKSRILALRDVAANQRISYDATYVTSAPARIAVIPVGYADGLSRQLSCKGKVIVGGQLAPIVGRVTMDLTMIDVTDIAGVEVGSKVILIGSDGKLTVSAWTHATLADTIPYEILCNISKRVPRKYVD